MPETPLGKVVQIRLEKDPKTISQFGEYERRIRAEWAKFKSSTVKEVDDAQAISQLQDMLKNLFSRG